MRRHIGKAVNRDGIPVVLTQAPVEVFEHVY
jgi:hypothetical protein